MAVYNTVAAVINAVTSLCDQRHMQANAAQSVAGALVAGGCSFIGGLVMGPIGIVIGGAMGTYNAFQMAKSKF